MTQSSKTREENLAPHGLSKIFTRTHSARSVEERERISARHVCVCAVPLEVVTASWWWRRGEWSS